MTEPADQTRASQILAELAEMGLALARDLQARALAAESAEEKAKLAAAFHSASRSVRQSLALDAKLQRDDVRFAREAAAEAVRDRKDRVSRRKAQVEAAVERLIWTEAEEDDSVDLCNALTERLEEAALYDDFLDGPIDAHIQRICQTLGVPFSLPVHGEGGPSAPERTVGGAGHAQDVASAPAEPRSWKDSS